MSSDGTPRLRILLAMLLMCCSSVACAEEEPVLTARPGLCILQDADTPQCVMGVELQWHGPAGDYCLFQSDRSDTLACWENREAGKLQTNLASPQDVGFWLQAAGSPRHLAEITVRVVRIAQQRPERRRRRHAWSPL